MEAGTWVRRQNGAQEERRYFDLRAECGRLLEEKPDVDEYESLLEDAIRLRLRSDVPISLHYSGGTDSTALLLKTKEVWGWDFPIAAFSMAFDEPAFDESTLAESYCAQIGAQHHKVTLSAAEVPALAAQLHYFEDEPYGGIPTIAYYKLNMVEREKGYIVSIEGQGGDETFGGYVYHAYMAMYDLARSGANPALLKMLLQTYRVEPGQAVAAAERLIAAGFQAHTDPDGPARAGHGTPAGNVRGLAQDHTTLRHPVEQDSAHVALQRPRLDGLRPGNPFSHAGLPGPGLRARLQSRTEVCAGPEQGAAAGNHPAPSAGRVRRAETLGGDASDAMVAA